MGHNEYKGKNERQGHSERLGHRVYNESKGLRVSSEPLGRNEPKEIMVKTEQMVKMVLMVQA